MPFPPAADNRLLLLKRLPSNRHPSLSDKGLMCGVSFNFKKIYTMKYHYSTAFNVHFNSWTCELENMEFEAVSCAQCKCFLQDLHIYYSCSMLAYPIQIYAGGRIIIARTNLPICVSYQHRTPIRAREQSCCICLTGCFLRELRIYVSDPVLCE